MSLNNEIRKIDLKAFSDLALYNQDIHDYEGFCSINSLYMNKRLNQWKRRPYDNEEFYSECKYKINGDNFDISIFNSDSKEYEKKFSISRKYFRLNEVESFPADSTEVTGKKYSDEDYKYYDDFILGEIGFNEDNCRLWHKGNYYVIYEKRNNDYTFSVYYISYKKNSSTKCITDISVTKKYSTTILNSDLDYLHVSFGTATYNIVHSDTPTTIENCIAVMACPPDTYIESLDADDLYYFTLVIDSDTNKVSLDTTHFYYKSPSSSESYYTGGYKSINIPWYGSGILSVANLGENINEKTAPTKYSICYQNGKTTDFNDDLPTPNHIESFEFTDVSYVKTGHSYHQTYKKKAKFYEMYLEEKYLNLEINFDAIETSDTFPVRFKYDNFKTYITNNFYLVSVKNAPSSISYGCMKIVDSVDSVRYIGNKVYFESNGKIYSLTLNKTSTPIFDVLNGNYLIFNTDSYSNAYSLIDDLTFCSCDDWNNSIAVTYVSDFIESDTDKIVSMPYQSILNYRWQSSSSVTATSMEYGTRIGNFRVKTTTNTSTGKSSNDVSIDDVYIIFDDSGYDTPGEVTYYSGGEKNTSLVQYEFYFKGKNDTDTDPMYQQGYISEENGFTTEGSSSAYVYTSPSDIYSYINNAPLLLTDFMYTSATKAYVATQKNTYELLSYTNEGNKIFSLFYLSKPVSAESASGGVSFYINGMLYVYDSKSNVIYTESADESNKVADASMFIYIGYTPKMAVFYCIFDHGIYAFTGDNTFTRLATLEKYSIKKVSEEQENEETSISKYIVKASAASVPSVNMLLINLTNAIGVLYNDQFCVIDIDEPISNFSQDNVIISDGAFSVNGYEYCLNKTEVAGYTNIPIHIETEFYGDPTDNSNTVNDTLYISVYNKGLENKGSVKIQTVSIQNNKIIESRVKEINLLDTDFNSYNSAQIKYQPEVQECRGIKFIIDSDFDITDIKIDTHKTSVSQTTHRL